MNTENMSEKDKAFCDSHRERFGIITEDENYSILSFYKESPIFDYFNKAWDIQQSKINELDIKNEKLIIALTEIIEVVDCPDILNITGVEINKACSDARSIALKCQRIASLAKVRN